MPLIVGMKHSNFSTLDFSLYSRNSIPSFSPKDICPTLAALMNIEIPRENKGKIIEEILQLGNFDESEKKLTYLDYRNQQQQLFIKELNGINNINN